MITSHVFVYGTLKEGFRNFHINRGCRVAGEFETAGPFALFVIGRYALPWLVEAHEAGQRVAGQVFEVDSATLAQMDRLERIDEPGWYQRTTIAVQPRGGGPTFEALVYLGSPLRLQTEVRHLGPLVEYLPEHQALYRKHV